MNDLSSAMPPPERSSNPDSPPDPAPAAEVESARSSGVSDPLIWGLLLCAFVVAAIAFYWLRERTLPPIGGFEGPTSTHGFPPHAGPFALQSAKEMEGPNGRPSHLVAVYQRGQEAPVTMEFYPIPAESDPDRWMDRRIAVARDRGAFEQRRGAVEDPEPGGRGGKREGSYAFLKGDRPGEPDLIVWTQQIAGQQTGFVISAPSLEVAKALRSNFRRIAAPAAASSP